jgi:peptidoglycan/xylan/chitin deacetylase (PgdA/CDA1 family)
MMTAATATYHTLEPFLEMFQGGVPMLMYHKIGARPARVRLRGLYVPPAQFARQLAELRQAGFVTCPPAQAISGAPGKRVTLTFDDGFLNVYQNALAPLAENHFCGVQFVVVNLIGKLNEWEIREGETPEPLMGVAQLREWLGAGHRIGSHSLSHLRLTRLSRRDAQEEILASKKKLEDMFGAPVEDFCYPYGDWNESVRDLVMEAGYCSACTTDFGVNTPAISPLALRRITVRHPTRSLKTLKARLMKRPRRQVIGSPLETKL